MVRRCSDKLAKLLMIIFNGVFMVNGIGIFVLGVNGVKFNSDVREIVQELSLVNVAVIVLGAIIFIISFMGFCGAWKESSCLITSFMLCMILILIAELAVAGVTFTNRNQLKDLLEKGMVKSFEKRNSSLTREAWDDIEVSLACCGVHSYKDYKGDLPLSCCKEAKISKCTPKLQSFSKDGCIKKVKNKLSEEYLNFGVAAIVVAFIEVVGIIFSCCLRSAINERYETV
ncbi:leukocyte surface antigen CD53-like isoform X1 [Varroa jacobsoni]|uniref:Tetraspanin n=1 Tax=Varroa destructor TaxID=109461 RepID=A0A7M7KY45_VARDE|nr:leukocyte surface antigen CD53-like isoform X1 [Varroa destructor]XP_022694404.1 leukocyte surface antigen CD53-like isoform X1 [Varroa jacobsoni]